MCTVEVATGAPGARRAPICHVTRPGIFWFELLGITVVFDHEGRVAATAARDAGSARGPRVEPAETPAGLRAAVAAPRGGRARAGPGAGRAGRDGPGAAGCSAELEAGHDRALHQGRPVRRDRPCPPTDAGAGPADARPA